MDIPRKLVVLTMVGTYVPGFRAGGPIRSIANLVEWLGDDISFKIITSDRDIGERVPYPGIVADSWQSVGRAQVFYLSPSQRSMRHVRQLITETPADVLYLNSAFATSSLIPLMLRRIGAISAMPIVLAPRGEFFPEALRIKSTKKRLFLSAARAIGLYDVAIWHASSPEEENQVHTVIGNHAKVVRAMNLPEGYSAASCSTPAKIPGILRLVFISRISPIKNLIHAIATLRGVTGSVDFKIYGPLEDGGYWEKCQQAISELPSNVTVKYCGEVEHHRVKAVLAENHALLFPTFSENFGHVILEALTAGLLVVTSDQTPWRNLSEARVGWDLPLTSELAFRDAVKELVAMDESEYRVRSNLARAYPSLVFNPISNVESYRSLFFAATQLGSLRSG